MAFNAGDIEARLELDRRPFETGLKQARADAERFEKRGIKLKVEIDKGLASKISQAMGQARGAGASGAINIPMGIAPGALNRIQDEVERVGDNTELIAARSGNRIARALLNPLVIQLGLLPGVAMASVGLAGAAMAGLPVVFAAGAAAAVKSNEDIKGSFRDMWAEISGEAEEAAAPLVGTFQGVADRILLGWRRLEPEIADIFMDAQPLIENLTDGVMQFAEEAIPRFGTAISQSGPIVRGFESLLSDLGVGLGDLTINMTADAVDMGRSVDLVGQFIRNLLADVGTLVAQFGSFWADVGPQFNATFDQMMDTLLQFTEGGLTGLTTGLGVTLSVLQAFLDVISPIAGIFGGMTGYLLSAVALWKLFGGAVGLASKAWGILNPAAWPQRLQGATDAIGNMATRTGDLTTRLTGSSSAGSRFEGAINRIGNAATKAVGWLPVVGAAVAGIQAAIDEAYPSADSLAEAMLRGGKAADDAGAKLSGWASSARDGSMDARLFAADSIEVKHAMEDIRASMTPLERAQQDVAMAQADLGFAMDKYGEKSWQARDATERLAAADGELEQAQLDAANAAKTHTDRLIEQQNHMMGAVGARLNYQSGLLQLEASQKSLTEAVRDHGVGSLEARQADISYQQQLHQVVQALGARVVAENQSKTETEQNRLATAAMNQEIARLAVEAGSNLPPALAQMAASLTDAELKALGVTRQTDDLGNSIYVLPPGKTLNFPTDAPVAEDKVWGLKEAVDSVPSEKWVDFYINRILTGDNPGSAGGLMTGLEGGRARGGPVRRNLAYWVGEEGPELLFPDQDGFVVDHENSKRLAGHQMGGAATPAPMLAAGSEAGAPVGFDYAGLVDALEAALARVLSSAQLRIVGSEWAQLVNQANARNDRR